jgi:hypothetical protein
MLEARFMDTPTGTLVVVDMTPGLLTDEIASRRFRLTLSRALGDISVILRSRVGESLQFSCDPSLRRYAVDPMVDALPVVGVDLHPPLSEAA